MEVSRKNYDEKLSELEEKTGDTGFFEAVMGTEHVPEESLAAMGANTTLEEFFAEMKAHGLEVHLRPKTHKASAPVERATLDKKAYAENLREASAKMGGDVGLIESVLEDTPDDPIEDINTASYEGEFSELGELAKKLKK